MPSSPCVLQTLIPSPNSSPRSRAAQQNNISGDRRVSSAAPVPSDAEPGLGIGSASAVSSPLQYCKHQAPVPPKEKTPRKLWNAIGGEDRRLIVLQRNTQQM